MNNFTRNLDKLPNVLKGMDYRHHKSNKLKNMKPNISLYTIGATSRFLEIEKDIVFPVRLLQFFLMLF